MSLRRILINIKTKYDSRPVIPIPNKGEPQFLKTIIRGEYDVHDVLISGLLRLTPTKQVYFFETHDLNIPNNMIGGRENHLIGDTCRMFYKVKIEGCKAQYFLWDGIVPEHLRELAYDYPSPYEAIIENQYGIARQQFDIGLAMGKMITKVVLTEKIKKAHQ